MQTATLTLHLPGVALSGEGGTLAAGRVAALSFKEWQQHDGAFPYAEYQYSRSCPVFWIGPVTFDEAEEGADMAAIAGMQAQIHDAFILDVAVPWLPSPAMSTCYLVCPPPPEHSDVVLSSWRSIIGPLEREWIVFGSEIRESFDAARLAAVQQRWEILECAGPAAREGPAGAALATLECTARPEYWWGTKHGASVIEFLQCVATCESLLLGDDPGGTLTDTFSQHAAALTARAPQDRAALANLWGRVYRLRTELVHGRRGLAELDSAQQALLPQPRRLLRDIAEAALRLADTRCRVTGSLPELLARASRSPAGHVALLQLLNHDGC